MSRKDDSSHVCDRCGADVGNAAIDKCVIVSDLDPELPGRVRNLHFCRKNGCDRKVLSKRNLRYLLEGDDGGSESDG